MCPHKVPLPQELPDDDNKNSDRGDVFSLKPAQTNYLNRPPRIMPNYGKKKYSVLPKSSISRVLLYDNVMQQQMLDVKLSNLNLEQSRTGRILDLHKKSFLVRQAQKERVLRAMGIRNVSFLPKILDSSPAKKSFGGKRKRSDSTNSSISGKKLDEFPDTLNKEIESVRSANLLPDINGIREIPFEAHEIEGLTTFFRVSDVNLSGAAEHPGNIAENETRTAISNRGNENRLSIANTSDKITVKSAASFIREESKLLTNGSNMDKPVFSAPINNLTKPRTMRRWPSLVHDPRFQALQNILHTMDKHTEGYIELSPSFRRQYVTIPEHLIMSECKESSQLM